MATFITYRNVSGKPVTLYHTKGMKDYTCAPNEEVQYHVGDDGETKGVKYGRVILKYTDGFELVPLSKLHDESVFKKVKEFSNVYMMNSPYYLLFWDEPSVSFKSYEDVGNQQFYINKGEKITLLVGKNPKTKFYELKADPIAGNCYQVDYYAGKNAWMPVYGLTEHADPISQYVQDIGETLGIGGDYDDTPDALEDGYGEERMVSLPELHEKILDIPQPVVTPAAAPLKVQVVVPPIAKPVDEPVAKAVEKMKSKAASGLGGDEVGDTSIPTWTKLLYVAGLPVGFGYAAYKNSGVWGFIGWGILGGIVFSIPYNYCTNKGNKGLSLKAGV